MRSAIFQVKQLAMEVTLDTSVCRSIGANWTLVGAPNGRSSIPLADVTFLLGIRPNFVAVDEYGEMNDDDVGFNTMRAT